MNFFILKYYLLFFMNQLSIYLYKRERERERERERAWLERETIVKKSKLITYANPNKKKKLSTN